MKKELSPDNYIHYDSIPESFENPIFDSMFDRSITNKHDFWKEQANEIDWYKPPSIILDDSDPTAPLWYPDGELNVCYNCLDRHVANGKGKMPALHSVSVYTGLEVTYTYE